MFFPAVRCLTYSTLFITRKPRRFFTPSPDEGCRSVKGTGSASTPPIDQCGQEEIASIIALFVTTNHNSLSHRCCNKQSFLTDHTPHRRFFGIVHVEMNHTWRQSGEVRPTNLFGFIGYSIVTLPSSSTYFSATQFCRITSSFTASSDQKQQSSPCTTYTPSNASEKVSGRA